MSNSKRIIKTVASITIESAVLVWWINLIFGFSSEVGPDSSEKSGSILVFLVNLINPSLDVTLDNYQNLAALENSEKILRKLAHMFEYGVLALLLWLIIRNLVCLWKMKREHAFADDCYIYIVTEVIVLIIGAFDELNQTHVSGRYGSWVDVIVDGVGAAAVLLICRFAEGRNCRKKS